MNLLNSYLLKEESPVHWYAITQTLVPLDQAPDPHIPGVLLLTSQELSLSPAFPGLESLLRHTPAARDVRVCKAEVHPDFLSGTLLSPRADSSGPRLTFGWLISPRLVVLVDDKDWLSPHLRRMVKEKYPTEHRVGHFFYGLMSLLIAKDLHRLEEIEDRAEELEDRVLSGSLEEFSPAMTQLRKSALARFRYYSQLDDVASRLRENENGFFTPEEEKLFRLFEERIIRLREESQLLREYCLQIQSMFQAEIDLRQNRIMKILTVVTTIFLPLSLLAGWYGMNFSNMPELTWEYGYPAVIGVGILIVVLSLWICKKKKFW